MTFLARLMITTLASFTAANLTASLFVPILWRRQRIHSPASSRASSLLKLRLLPLGISLVVTTLSFVSFWRFEPRVDGERTGIVLQILAAMAVVVIAVGCVRLLRVILRTRRTLKSWMANAQSLEVPDLSIPAYAVDATFPVVAVAGFFRPRLIVARSVLAACSRQQITAVLAHERGHLRHHDNLRRALITAAPDVLSWLPLSQRFEESWHAASEEAADDLVESRLDLAEALLRVARLAPVGVTGVDLPASAFYCGKGLEHRVRRLLDDPAAGNGSTAWNVWAVLIVPLMLLSVFSLPAFHEVIETAVQYLP